MKTTSQQTIIPLGFLVWDYFSAGQKDSAFILSLDIAAKITSFYNECHSPVEVSTQCFSVKMAATVTEANDNADCQLP